MEAAKSSKRDRTCAERVQEHAERRIDYIRTLVNPDGSDIEVEFALDARVTVRLGDVEQDFDADIAITDSDIDLDGVLDNVRDDFNEARYEALNEYGLSLEYRPTDEKYERLERANARTCRPKTSGHIVWVLSTGGPHEEIRFFIDAELDCYRIEFWLLDWFDGASVTITDKDELDTLKQVFNDWKETETIKHLVEEARRDA